MDLGAREGDMAVQQSAIHRCKGDIDILDRSKRVEIGVSAFQPSLREHLTGFEGGTLTEYPVAQEFGSDIRINIISLAGIGMQDQPFRHARGVIVGMETNTADGLLGIDAMADAIGNNTLIVGKVHLQFDRVIPVGGVGGIRKKRLVKIVVPPVAHGSGNALALFVQRSGIIDIPHFDE